MRPFQTTIFVLVVSASFSVFARSVSFTLQGPEDRMPNDVVACCDSRQGMCPDGTKGTPCCGQGGRAYFPPCWPQNAMRFVALAMAGVAATPVWLLNLVWSIQCLRMLKHGIELMVALPHTMKTNSQLSTRMLMMTFHCGPFWVVDWLQGGMDRIRYEQGWKHESGLLESHSPILLQVLSSQCSQL